MPSFWNRWSLTSSNDVPKQDKSVLSDIQQGSQKLGRLNSASGRSPKQPESSSPVVTSPVDEPTPADQNTTPGTQQTPTEPELTSLPPPPPIPESEPLDEQVSRKSTESRPYTAGRKSFDRIRHSRRSSDLQRSNSKPRRSGSMRRAYNYMFGGSHAQQNQQTETLDNKNDKENVKPQDVSLPRESPQTSGSTENGEPEVFHEVSENPSNTTKDAETSPDKLKDENEWYKKELAEAAVIIQAQHEAIEESQKRVATLQQYEEKNAALHKSKKAIEDHMVSVVVQQVKEARESEREAVLAECQQDYTSQLEDMRKAQMGESMAMIRDRDAAREELKTLKARNAELESASHSEIMAHKSRIGDLERGIGEKQAAHDEISKQRADLHVQLNDALSNISALEADLSEDHHTRAELNDFKRQIEDLTHERASFKKALESTKSNHGVVVSQLTTQHETSRAALANAEASNEQLKAQMTELKEDLSKQLNILRAERSNLGEELAAAKAATEALTTEHTTQQETAKGSIATAEESNHQLKLQLAELQASLDTAGSNSKEQLEAFETHKLESQRALDDALISSRDVADNVADLKTSLEETKVALKKAQARHSLGQSQFMENESNHREALKSLESELTTLRDHRDRLSLSSEAKAAELAVITTDRDAQVRAYEEAKSKIAELELELSNVSRVVADRDSHAKAHDATKEELIALTTERDGLVEAHGSTETKLTEITAALALAEAAASEHKVAAESSEKKLSDIVAERDGYATILGSTKAELTRLTVERDNHVKAHDSTKAQLVELIASRDARLESADSIKVELEAETTMVKTLEQKLADMEKEIANSVASLSSKEEELKEALKKTSGVDDIAKQLEGEKAAAVTLAASFETSKKELEAAQSEINSFKAKVEELSKVIEDSKTGLEDSLAKTKNFENEAATAKDLQDKYAQLQKDYEAIKVSEASLKEKHEALEQEIVPARASVDRVGRLEKDLEISRSDLSTVQEKYSSLEKDLSTSKVSAERVLLLESKLAAAKTATDRAEQLEKELRDLTATERSLQAKREELEAALTLAQSQEQASSESLTSKEADLVALKSELEFVNSRLQQAEATSKELESVVLRKNELEAKNLELNATLTTLRGKSTETEKSLELAEQYQVSAHEAEQKLRSVEARMAELETEVTALRSTAETSQKALKDLDGAHESVRAELKAKILELENSHEHATQLKQSLQDAKASHSAIEDKLTALEAAHTKGWEQVGADVEKTKQRETDLLAEIEQHKSEKEALQNGLLSSREKRHDTAEPASVVAAPVKRSLVEEHIAVVPEPAKTDPDHVLVIEGVDSVSPDTRVNETNFTEESNPPEESKTPDTPSTVQKLENVVKSAMKVTVETAKHAIGGTHEEIPSVTTGTEKADSAVGTSADKISSDGGSPRRSPRKSVSFKDGIPGQDATLGGMPIPAEEAVVEHATPIESTIEGSDSPVDTPVSVPATSATGDEEDEAEEEEEEDEDSTPLTPNGKQNNDPLASAPKANGNSKKNKKKGKGKKK